MRLAILAASALIATPASAATLIGSGTFQDGQFVSAYSEQANYAPLGDYFFRLLIDGHPQFGFLDGPKVISGLGAHQFELKGPYNEFLGHGYNLQQCCGYSINFRANLGANMGDGRWTLHRERLWRGNQPVASAQRMSAGSLAATAAVPETPVWIAMLLGFGALGTVARMRRRDRRMVA